jgi:hypothetical protein
MARVRVERSRAAQQLYPAFRDLLLSGKLDNELDARGEEPFPDASALETGEADGELPGTDVAAAVRVAQSAHGTGDR